MAQAGSWRDLKPGLSDKLLTIIEDKLNFHSMTPVQAATLPKFLQHKDVAVEAPTGSGKTLAFVIPMLDKVLRREDPLKKNEVGALVITPTRELAEQIYQVAKIFIDELQVLSILLLIGGTDVDNDMRKFRTDGGNIVIATPGRLNDIMNRMPDFKMKELEVLVLDEADRLLDMGFHATVTNILSKLPKQRRTGLFSATQTKEVSELVKAGLRNPVKVSIKVEDKRENKIQAIPSTYGFCLGNFYMTIPANEKLNQLVAFIAKHKEKKIIVYFLTCACVNFFWWVMRELEPLKDHPIFSLHGQVPPKKRSEVYNKFLTLPSGVLLSTDLSARGLDFHDVDWIIQYDPPQDPSFFIHRIGRTARIGREGNAIVYIMPGEEAFVEFLGLKNVPIHEMKPEEPEKNYLAAVKKITQTEREAMEKGHVAFVSYIRGYKEHKLNYIFRLSELDLGKLAQSFALLRLPGMSELKNVGSIDFQISPINPRSVKYKDKRREKQRQEKLKRIEEERAAAQKAAEEEEEEEIDDVEDQESSSEDESDQEDSESEEEFQNEFIRDQKMLSKLKRGLITKDEYDDAVGEKAIEAEMEAKYAELLKNPGNNKKKGHHKGRPHFNHSNNNNRGGNGNGPNNKKRKSDGSRPNGGKPGGKPGKQGGGNSSKKRKPN